MPTEISKSLKKLLTIVRGLNESYPEKKFTLDGRLVGDIGETLARLAYDIKIFPKQKKGYDGLSAKHQNVQIKATLKNSLTFPANFTPEYYLGIQIHHDGRFTEVFNGPGKLAKKAVKNRKKPKGDLYSSINIETLVALSKLVPKNDRIPLRAKSSIRPIIPK